MTPRILVAALAGVTATACGASPPESQTGGTTGISGAASSSSSDDESSSSTTGDVGDPEYPRPFPVDQAGMCPGTSFGPITFEGSAWICIPECGMGSSCPAPVTGTAEATCATAPFSSAMPCQTSLDCTVEGEMCGNAGGGSMACLLPPTHCILRCDAATTCPDEMTCTMVGICAYLP